MPSGTPLGSMFIELGLDTSQFASDVNGAKRAVNFFKAETRALDVALKGNGRNVDLLKAKHKSLKQTIDAQKNVLDGLKKKFDKLEPGTAKWEAAAVQIERENAKLSQMERELAQVEGALQKVHVQNSRWGQASAKLSGWGESLNRAGSKLRAMGDAMKPISTLLSGGFALATKKAMDFEGQMQTTKALLSDTTNSTSELNQQTTKLGEASKSWARKYRISTAQINEGMQELIKGGLDANQTMGAMPAILRASKATGEDFNGVMNAATSIMSQFGLTSSNTQTMLKNTNRVTDSLSFVANKTKAGFMDMGNAMVYVGPVAKSVGMDIEETAAAVGLLSNAGIAGEKAGTALRGALTRLLKPSEQNAEAMKQLGFSSEEFRSGAIGLPDILDRIKKSTEGMTDADKAALIAKAFGTEAQSAMNALVNEGGDALRDLTGETKDAKGYTKQLADQMMKGSKSGAEKFKSALEVLQITIGQKLLPILTPVIEKITEWVDTFAKAPKPVQTAGLALAGFLALGYPTLNFLGNLSTVAGSTFSWLGKIAGQKAAATTISGFGTEAGAAATKAGLLAKSGGLLSALMSSTGLLVVGAIAAGAGIAYFAHKANEARQRTEEWGTKVSATEANELTKFKAKVDETNQAMAAFGSEGSADVEKIKEAFKGLTDEINKLTDKQLAKDLKLAEKLGFSDEEIQKIKDRAAETKEVTNKMADDVVKIYQRASDNHRELTETEREIVKSAQNAMIEEKLALMGKEKDETIAIRKAMNGEVNELNQQQAAKGLATVKSWIEEENKAYKKQKADLKDLYKRGVIDTQQYHRELEEAEASHKAVMEGYEERYLELQKKVAEEALKNSNPEARKAILNTIKDNMDKLGLSYDKFTEKMRGASQSAAETSSLVGTYWQGMSEEARAAVDYWNSIILDPVTGEVKTNAQEEIQKALQAEGGWEAMQLSLKEGRMTTDAKIAVGEALIETGKWEALSPSEKELVTNNKPALEAIFDSETMLNQWNALPVGVKKILGENNSFLNSKEAATNALNTWNLLQPHQKELIAKDLASEDVNVAQQAINQLTGKTIIIDANNETGQAALEANLTVNGVKHEAPIGITAEDKTAEASTSAQTNVNLPYQLKPIDMFGANKTMAAVTQTNKSVNSPKQNSPIGMFGANKTGPAVTSAKSSVNSVKQNNPTSIKAKNDTGDGVGRALNSLSQIPAVKWVSIQAKKIGDFLGLKNGTNYHQGGPAIVNDQKGPTYKELVTLPSGQSFIPEGRDVMLPLPRGSKVLKASRTKSLMKKLGVPKYRDGIGIPEDATFLKDIKRTQNQMQIVQSNDPNSDEMVRLLREILLMMNRMKSKSSGDSPVYLDMDKVGQKVSDYMHRRGVLVNRLKGEV